MKNKRDNLQKNKIKTFKEKNDKLACEKLIHKISQLGQRNVSNSMLTRCINFTIKHLEPFLSQGSFQNASLLCYSASTSWL